MKHCDFCKKCTVDKEKHFFYLITVEDGMFIYKSKKCYMKIPEENFDYDKNIPEVYMGIKEMTKFTDRIIEPNTSCPYYVENQINDWNKKK